MRIHVFLLGLLINGVLGGSNTTKLKRTPRIVNGKRARLGQHPYIVSLQVKKRRGLFHRFVHYCGGVLVEPDIVVTAAHCTKYEPELYASAGITSERNFGDHRVKVKMYISNDYDKSTKVNDISVLKLEKPFPILKNGRPLIDLIRLPEKHYKPKGACTIAGWGKTKHGGSYPGILLFADVPVFNHSECKELYKYKIVVEDTMMCAGGGDADGCQGDSGGPLICYGPNNKRYLTGIASWGMGCGIPQVPGMYTEVAKYIDFIKDSIEDLRPLGQSIEVLKTEKIGTNTEDQESPKKENRENDLKNPEKEFKDEDWKTHRIEYKGKHQIRDDNEEMDKKEKKMNSMVTIRLPLNVKRELKVFHLG